MEVTAPKVAKIILKEKNKVEEYRKNSQISKVKKPNNLI